MFDFVSSVMRSAVDLYDQNACVNGEIGDIRTDGMLASEVVAVLAKQAEVFP